MAATVWSLYVVVTLTTSKPSWQIANGSPLAECQTRIVWSDEPETIIFLLAENAQHVTYVWKENVLLSVKLIDEANDEMNSAEFAKSLKMIHDQIAEDWTIRLI